MRLENLYLNFGEASPEMQALFIASYRLKRAQDMEKPSTYKKKVVSIKVRLELTEEEKVVMKMLGLKQKDILALRATSTEVEAEEPGEETGDLFKDELLEEEEEV
jgi:hypothetical protein